MQERTPLKKSVLLVTWDSYPQLTSGGVYSWAKGLVEALGEFDFLVFSQLSKAKPKTTPRLPPNVRVIPHQIPSKPAREVSGSDGKLRRPGDAASDDAPRAFLSLYEEFIDAVLSPSLDPEKTRSAALGLRGNLRANGLADLLRHPATWEVFLDKLRADPVYKGMKLSSAQLAYRTVQSGLQTLCVDLPKVDLALCSVAWLPSLVALAAKQEQGCPLVLVEHGVAFRELTLYHNAYLPDDCSKVFWKVLAANVVKLLYHSADVVAPVCAANSLWETALGAAPEKLRVIYNGVDLSRFRPLALERPPGPTVVSVARVDPFKDIGTLIRSIWLVKKRLPKVQCRLYGDARDPEYVEGCVRMVERLGLGESFHFMGHTDEPELAYNSGDVVAFSSLTEGFPFSVIEAMACGKAVVATSVGGVPEALEGCGLLVRSRNPRAMADAILKLLTDEALGSEIGRKALARAQSKFSLETAAAEYRRLFSSLLADREGAVRGEEPWIEA